MNNIHSRQTRIACALALTFTLAGCGGGGGGGTATPTPSTPVATAALQGIWQSPVGAASTISAIALPSGQLWAISTSAGVTQLTKASLVVQGAGFGGSGKSYTLGSSASSSVSATATASVVEKSSLSGTLTLASGQPQAFALAYQSRYDTPAALTDLAGSWQATLGPGVVNWTLGATGVLSGTRTTGCTYSGQLSLRAEQKAVVDAAVTENCAGTVVQLAGVAVLSSDKSRISMVLTTADEATGVVLSLAH